MKQISEKPTRLLMLPIVVWAVTFTFGTIWFYILLESPRSGYLSSLLIYSMLTVITANAIVLVGMYIASQLYEDYKKELLKRTAFMLVNIPVAFVYFIIMCRFAKFLN